VQWPVHQHANMQGGGAQPGLASLTVVEQQPKLSHRGLPTTAEPLRPANPHSPLHLHPRLPQDRGDLVDQLEKRPDAMWRTGTIWSFKNDAKVVAGGSKLPRLTHVAVTALLLPALHAVRCTALLASI
jgi:hypothetical protein